MKLEIPDLPFSPWRAWNLRDRPSADFDVPREFGIFGLCLLADGHGDSSCKRPSTGRHLCPKVIYIGMSQHVDRRLKEAHHPVKAYRLQYRGEM
ncbi:MULTISPECIES: hypothetical protein [unclassified Caballeronia]|uniref:hypothetical protein n=1 Tax=unclassified Caballeronia TaxID=2646786 RepID=UPI001F3CE73E|nr:MULTISPECIES: hypothetical protein [unclassified Caballeronia]MCE4546498.1 hypothetical protein [Caballeronia sp. PC1]MCE4573028.1 hypothetical protein [Caballeronia sp. CLC5]